MGDDIKQKVALIDAALDLPAPTSDSKNDLNKFVESGFAIAKIHHPQVTRKDFIANLTTGFLDSFGVLFLTPRL